MFDNIPTSSDKEFMKLMSKDIIWILQGDTEFGTIESIDIKMPYLSKDTIIGICRKFGMTNEILASSRWEFTEALLKHGIQQRKSSEILAFLFSKHQFKEMLLNVAPDRVDSIHTKIVENIIEQLNNHLRFSDSKLITMNNRFEILPIGSAPKISIPSIRKVDSDYIKDISARALRDIENGNFDSATTKSRTLLEEVFIHAITSASEKASEEGDIGKLYKDVRRIYHMHTDRDQNRRINQLLSGLNNIVSAIAEERNKNSDSHGVGKNRVRIKDYHARLIVNSATTVAEFILSVVEQKIQ